MIKNVSSVGLPVGEVLHIRKNTLVPSKITGEEKRICIVTGIHGDELEGQYVCYELIRRINQNIEHLNGIIDVYPAVNPLGLESVSRGMPTFDLEFNHLFPGNMEGDLAESTAAKLVEDIIGADMCIDLHASNIFIREIPQVRLTKENYDKLIPYAKLLNVDFVWVHESATVLESTLVYSLNKMGVPALAVEMGVGMRITKEYGEQLVEGIFALLKEMGVWSGECIIPKKPIISTDGEVTFLHAEDSGIFVPKIEHWRGIKKGDPVGDILDPFTGKIVHHVIAPCDGMVFTLREYPVVHNGSLIARILGGVL
jgi:predicted deacylase